MAKGMRVEGGTRHLELGESSAPSSIEGRPGPGESGSPAVRDLWHSPQEPPASVARQIWELQGPLSSEQRTLVESQVSYLSDAQLDHLVEKTDLVKRSPVFAAVHATRSRLSKLLERYWDPTSDDEIRARLGEWIQERSLTAASAAKALAVLLSGDVSGQGSSSPAPGDAFGPEGEPTTDLGALRKMLGALMALEPLERERFVRATCYELRQIDGELVNRVVEQLGLDAVHHALPAVGGSTVEAVADDLGSQEKVRSYLRAQRVDSPLRSPQLSSQVLALVGKAKQALARADAFASEHSVDLSSDPAQLERARGLYRAAAERFREVLAADRLALQNPDVQRWMSRRAKALVVRSAVLEVESGALSGTTGRALRSLVRELPGAKRLVRAPGLAEPALLSSLEASLGFDPAGALSPSQRARLVEELGSRTLLDAGPDPLIKVMLDPDLAASELSHVCVLLAPGVVPIAGVLGDTLRAVEERFGVQSKVADTGFFESEEDNARAIRAEYQKILSRDSAAEIVLLGYSQGAVNGLFFLDQLRSGSEEDRRQADRHLRGMISLYGAHNGSPAARAGVDETKRLLEKLPMGKRLAYLLSGSWGFGRKLAGGVDSLMRSKRHDFWKIANLPEGVPYVSLTAVSQPEEVPFVLDQGYEKMKKEAKKLGLPPDNDTQVLRFDAPLGNEETDAGRMVRRSNTNVEVRGHHWNPLRAKHMLWDDPAKYAFPKLPQVAAPLELMAELGLIGRG